MLSEIDLVKLCRRFDLPAPDLQERRRDSSGRVRYIDAYWRDFKVQVEIDGAHHMDVRHWEADVRCQDDVWLSGDRTLRFSAWRVRHQPDYIAGEIREALAAAGWSGLASQVDAVLMAHNRPAPTPSNAAVHSGASRM